MKRLPIMILSGTMLFSVPAFAEEKTTDSGDLETRIEQLEERVSDLEDQIATLLKLLGASSVEEAETASIPDVTTEVPEGMIGYNEEVQIGDWTATMTSYEFNEKFEDPSDPWGGSFTADSGSKFLKVGLTVTNNGTQANTFVENWYPSANDIQATVFYMDKYEFEPGNFIDTMDIDLTNASIKPLETREGYVVFKVSDAVVDSDESLTMELTCNKETYTFQVR
mgnify:CR=1 FL=1